jgi:hypothetical protein
MEFTKIRRGLDHERGISSDLVSSLILPVHTDRRPLLRVSPAYFGTDMASSLAAIRIA